MAEYFERFDGLPNKRAEERIHITLNHRGVIYLNRNAHALLGGAEAVALYFNKADGVIGLRAVRADQESSFPVSRKETSYLVRANPFCRHFGIAIPEGSVAFLNPQVDTRGILRLDLRTAKATVRRPRARVSERRLPASPSPGHRLSAR